MSNQVNRRQYVMYAKEPYSTISRAMHIHPTVSELVPTLLQDLRLVG